MAKDNSGWVPDEPENTGWVPDDPEPANAQTAFNPVGDTAPLPSRTDLAWGEAPAFIGSNLSLLGNTFKSRVPLAALGAAGGEGYRQAYQALTGSPEQPLDMLDSAKRMAMAGGAYGAGQGVGEALVGGLVKAWPSVKSKFALPGLESAEAEMRSYMNPYLEGGGLSERVMDWTRSKLPQSMQWEQYPKPGFTLAQKTDPLSGVSRAEQIVESSLTGRSPIAKFKWAQEKGLKDWSDKLSSDIWAGVEKMPPSEQGKVFAEGFQVAENKFKEDAKLLYQNVDSLTQSKEVISTWPGTNITDKLNIRYYVNVSDVVKNAKKLVETNEKYKNLGATERGEAIIKQIAEQEDVHTFAGAAELRSRLLQASDQMRGDVGRAHVKGFLKDVDSAMEKAAESLPNNAKEAWRAANAFYKEGKQTYNNEFIRSLVDKGKDQPELVGKALFQNGEITQIKAAKKVLTENPQAWQNLKAGYFESLLENAKNVSTDPTLISKTFSNQLKKMGAESLQEIFTIPEILMIQNFEKAALATQSKAPGSGGSMLVQLLQAGAAGSAVTGALLKDPLIAAGGITILATPRVLANMMVNPKWHTLFMQGLSADKARAIPAITRLSAGAVEVERKLTEKENDRRLQKQILDQAQYR